MAEQYKTTGSLAVMEKQRVIVIEAADRPQNIRVRVAAYVRVKIGRAHV